MPNIKSAEKRVKVARVKTLSNTKNKSTLKTAVKKCKKAITKKDAGAVESLKNAIKTIDKAAARNILHKNTAARKKSALVKAFNTANK